MIGTTHVNSNLNKIVFESILQYSNIHCGQSSGIVTPISNRAKCLIIMATAQSTYHHFICVDLEKMEYVDYCNGNLVTSGNASVFLTKGTQNTTIDISKIWGGPYLYNYTYMY